MAIAAPIKPAPKISEDYYWPPPQGQWTYDDYARLPGNPAHDRHLKFQAYALARVQEYWLIDPDLEPLKLMLRGQAYASAGIFGVDGQIYSEVLPEFTAPVNEICPA